MIQAASLLIVVVLSTPCLGIPKMLGGQPASLGQFPHMVSLRDHYDLHACGGCIITPRTILTAAHCLLGVKPEDMTVVTGTTKQDTIGARYKASRIIPHPGFNTDTAQTDVGVIILERDIVFDANTKAIDVGTEEIGVGLNVTLSGWGTTSYPGTLPNDLQWLTFRTIAFAQCEAAFEGINEVYEDQLCVLNGPGQGACHFDSGSPLVHGGKVVGVASFVFACAMGYPDVFARVSSYVDWIEANKV